ncbi:hypothetical protein ES703_61321 [subsurface metagenome]
MEIGFDAIKNLTIAEVLELEKQYFIEEEHNVLEENKE